MTNTPTTPTRPQAVTALREIARALSAAWDLDTALDLIARKTTEVMLVDSCTIYLLDPDGRSLRLRASTGLAQRALGRATLRVGEGLTGHAIAINQPVFAADAQNHPLFKWVNEAHETDFVSLLAIPLSSENAPIGALNVQTLTPHHFTADEIEVLSLIGDLAAGTLAKAQLYDDQKRQIEELQALAQVSELVTSPQYLDEILDVVTRMASQVMGALACAIFLLEEDEGERKLVLHAAQLGKRPFSHLIAVDTDTSFTAQVVRSGEPRIVRDLQSMPNALPYEKQYGFVSLLSVPLSVRNRVIGALNCYTGTPRDFSDAQRTLFLTLANQTALAIENARLVTNAAIVREMHHRIKNNLQTVAMLMQLQLPEADRLDTREVLLSNMHRIQSIATVHEVLSEGGLKLVDVKDALQRIIQMALTVSLRPDQHIHMQVHGEHLLLPSRSATALVLVVNELVQNALEHAFPNSIPGSIDISLGRSPEQLIVLVRDDGLGMPPDYTPGLGLEIATTLVKEDLRGTMRFNQPVEGGTEISIRMPRALEREL